MKLYNPQFLERKFSPGSDTETGYSCLRSPDGVRGRGLGNQRTRFGNRKIFYEVLSILYSVYSLIFISTISSAHKIPREELAVILSLSVHMPV